MISNSPVAEMPVAFDPEDVKSVSKVEKEPVESI